MNSFSNFLFFISIFGKISPGKETLVQDIASGAQAHPAAAHVHFGCCSACFEIVLDTVSITTPKCLDVDYKPKNVHSMGPKVCLAASAFF